MKPNYFAGGDLDRASALRRDDDWLTQQRAAADSRVLLVRGSNVLVQGEPPRVVFLSPEQVESLAVAPGDWLFLGLDGGRAVFCAEWGRDAATAALTRATGGEFDDLRLLGTRLDRVEGALVAYATSLARWNRRFARCTKCGRETLVGHGGHLRVCGDPACGVQQFPRTDPAIITLVTSGKRCLLAREASWPPLRYATIAGFLDPGESLEEAVVREVHEETGLTVTRVRYHSSQPWPFPGTIMIGFNAEVEFAEPVIDPSELEDARWFTREELRDAVVSRRLKMPSRVSISNRLVVEWYQEDPPAGSPELLAPVIHDGPE